MARTRNPSGEEDMARRQSELTPEEKKRLNIELRGGRYVGDEEEQRDLLGQSTDQAGEHGGELSREQGVEQELESRAAKPGGRRGGRTSH